MGVKVVAHVTTLGLHIGTPLVEERGRDHVAPSVDLPSDGGVSGADFVVTGGSSGGSCVLGDLLSHFSIDNHSTHKVEVEIIFVVDNDNGDDLAYIYRFIPSFHFISFHFMSFTIKSNTSAPVKHHTIVRSLTK
ncbi:unnamed protein product [Cylindrotheca closterium]|uniref:Uncharacterized protein n=1 Tax=Cylindrotheca closterium TaxID=2856 RepID=A0AAD2PW36_9STRA|nr:unnamed protein product [Cylindrotheca closterium]